MKEGVIKLTEQEANKLIDLVNIAVKVKGLEEAASGIFFLNKVQEAFKSEAEVLEPSK